MNWTIPNILTVGRLLLLPPMIALFFIHIHAANAEELTCNSYGAIYKPHPSTPDYEHYTMTIEVIPQPDGYMFTSYDKITVTKSDKNEDPIYELYLTYACGGGSAPHCSIGAETTGPKGISIIPQALNKDLSFSHFINRGRKYDAHKTAPYVLTFPGSMKEFYYKGDEISEKNLSYFTSTKEHIKLAPVWLLSGCQ